MNAAWALSSPRLIAAAVAASWVKVTVGRAGAAPAARAPSPAPRSSDQATSSPAVVGDHLLQDDRRLAPGAAPASAAAASVGEPLGAQERDIGGRLPTRPPGIVGRARPGSRGGPAVVRRAAVRCPSPCATSAGGRRCSTTRPVRGRWKVMEGPPDVLELMDTGADGRDRPGARRRRHVPGADLPRAHRGGVHRRDTSRSHIGIVSREFQVPCIMACELDEVPADDGRRSSSTARATPGCSVARSPPCGSTT